VVSVSFSQFASPLSRRLYGACVAFAGVFSLTLPLASSVVMAAPPALLRPKDGYHPMAPKIAYLQPSVLTPNRSGGDNAKWASLKTILPGTLTVISPGQGVGAFGPKWIPTVALKAPAMTPSSILGGIYQQVDLSPIQSAGPMMMGYFNLKPTWLEGAASAIADASVMNFYVSDGVFWNQLQSSLTALTFHRSGQTIGSKRLGLVVYAGHLNDAEPHASAKTLANRVTAPLNMTGGWYDTNSYRKSLSHNALIAGQLLGIYQLNPERFRRLELPYQPPGKYRLQPPLLQEARFGLEWLIAMQDTEGLFFSKVDGLEPLPASTAASSDTQVRYYFAPEKTASLMAIGALAKGSQVFDEKSDLAFGIACLRAAEKGMAKLTQDSEALAANPESYSERAASLWAYTELFVATGKLAYLNNVQTLLADGQWIQPGQSTFAPALQALQACLFLNTQQKRASIIPTGFLPDTSGASVASTQDPNFVALQQQAIRLTLQWADTWVNAAQNHPWGLPLPESLNPRLPELLAQAQVLGWASLLPNQAKAPDYRLAALRSYDFVKGVNPWGFSLVTSPPASLSSMVSSTVKTTASSAKSAVSTGSASSKDPLLSLFTVEEPPSVLHPCHPISQASRKAIPGLVVQGVSFQQLQSAVYKDQETDCLANQGSLPATMTFSALTATLNEAFDRLAVASSAANATTTSKKKLYKLPTLR
jgi:Glycosyl hydrolase family 9